MPNCPIIYHDGYNIQAFGFENLHPFDSCKWRRVVNFLTESVALTTSMLMEPTEPTAEQLLKVHSDKYLKSIRKPIKAAQIVEVGMIGVFPPCIIDSRLLRPLRLQTGGSVLAAEMCLTYGWAINIGGGFHHASYEDGGGFCFYADITLAIRELLDAQKISNAIIVDLDAHQGNGHARDFSTNPSVYIFDMFNPHIYPHDREARQYINNAVHLDHHTTDNGYISMLKKQLAKSLSTQSFDILIYNAGTDCLDSDPLGGMSLSPQAILDRDEVVFKMAKSCGIPICMLTSGGYQKNNARIIANSILNLRAKKLINF